MKLFRHNNVSQVSPSAILFALGLAVLLSANPARAEGPLKLTPVSAGPSSYKSHSLPNQTQAAQGHAWLIGQAQQWVAEHEGLRAHEVEFLPLDERASLKACDQALQIDAPFGTTQTLRMRCPSTKEQVFLKRRQGGIAIASSPSGALNDRGSQASVRFGQPIARSSSESARTPASSSSRLEGTTARPGAIEFEATVLVATANLASNQPLQPGMFVIEKRKLPTNPSQFFSEFEGLEHLELSRPVTAGSPLRRSDTRKSVLVRKGSPVQFLVSSVPGLRLTVKLEAVEDGFIGEQIRLRNPESGKVMVGLVTARGEVKGL